MAGESRDPDANALADGLAAGVLVWKIVVAARPRIVGECQFGGACSADQSMRVGLVRIIIVWKDAADFASCRVQL